MQGNKRLSFILRLLKNAIVAIITSAIPIYVSYKNSPTKETIVTTIKTLMADELTQNILICFAAAYFIASFLKRYLWIQIETIESVAGFCYLIIKDLYSLFKSVLLSFSGIAILTVTLWPIFEPNTFSIKGLIVVLVISYPYLVASVLMDIYDEKNG